MRRWQTYGKLDTPVATEGDRGFTALRMTGDRALLPQGMLARSENKRLRNGSATTRLGNVWSSDFNPGFTGRILGSAIYSNPNGDEVMLVATAEADYVWALQFGKDPVKINLVAGQTLTGALGVEFVQAFEKVLLLRRPSGAFARLVWDGVNANTFNVVTTPGPATLIPATWNGEPFQNRVVLYNANFSGLPWRDQIVMTDVLDYTQYDNVLSVFRVNAGESDWITRVWPYYRGALVILKRRTLHLLQDFTLDPSLAFQRMLSKRIGAIATRCVLEAGSDLYFLSDPGGIYKLSEVIQDQIGAEPTAVSEPIQPAIDDINWQLAVWSAAEVLGEYLFFMVPLKHGGWSMLVYNVATRNWESVDKWGDPRFRIDALHATQYDGGRALFGIDYANKQVYVLYKSIGFDEIHSQLVPIRDLIETRGYTMGEADTFKQFQRTAIALRTSDPEVTITALMDGVNEEKMLTPEPITRNRLTFYPHGHAEFVPGVDDPNEPYREDYSAGELIDFSGEDFMNLPVGPIKELPATAGFTVSQAPQQQSLERLSVRTKGRWCSLRVENESGTCEVLATGVEAIPAMSVRTAV
jgi:hypothetical protein